MRITFTMAAPVVFSGGPIHFDSLLSWVKIHRQPSTTAELDAGQEPCECVTLPLLRMRHGSAWWFRASAVVPLGVSSQQFWSKKFEHQHEDMLDMGKATQVPLTMGRFKETMGRLETVWMPELVFYAVGFRKNVNRLAKHITHIGKKASQGFGRVVEMKIETLPDPIDSFTSDWKTSDGQPARNLPVEFARNHGLAIEKTCEAPVTPPYWRVLAGNVTEAAIPA